METQTDIGTQKGITIDTVSHAHTHTSMHKSYISEETYKLKCMYIKVNRQIHHTDTHTDIHTCKHRHTKHTHNIHSVFIPHIYMHIETHRPKDSHRHTHRKSHGK